MTDTEALADLYANVTVDQLRMLKEAADKGEINLDTMSGDDLIARLRGDSGLSKLAAEEQQHADLLGRALCHAEIDRLEAAGVDWVGADAAQNQRDRLARAAGLS